MVKYKYDAWGNHKVVDSNGNEITDSSDIGNLNPFRYRGYYYDTETELYYLQTRYYDPVVGRFLNRDSVSYADPETINGLNLYSYCLNNPVMGIDSSGTLGLTFILLSMLGGAIIGGISSGIKASKDGLNTGETLLAILGGAIMGAAVSGAFALGGAAVAGLTVASHAVNLSGVTMFAIATYSTIGAGMADYALTSIAYDIPITRDGLILSGLNGLVEGTTAFLAGMFAGFNGYFKYADKSGIFNINKTFEKISRAIKFSLPSALIRTVFKRIGQKSWGINW